MEKDTGYSSPAISQGRLVYFHREGDQEKVECLHAETGEKYWDFSYPTRFEDRYGYNSQETCKRSWREDTHKLFA